MPEGHSIHRVARVQARWLVGRRFEADSPQGRFDAGARALSGRALLGVAAHGKNLFYRFEGGVHLHVHLGLFGRIRHFRAAAPAPSAACRLQLRASGATLQLVGPGACALQDEEGERALRARLGEDPLHPDAQPARALAALRRSRAPLAQALLDQARLAGVGNILRTEALFLAGLHPLQPAAGLAEVPFARLWAALTALLQDGARDGRIVTPGAPRAAAPGRRREDAFCAYGRAGLPCVRCGTVLAQQRLAGRGLTWCPGCQREGR